MDKVFVKVDYQVLAGGAIRPTRIHWHDGRMGHSDLWESRVYGTDWYSNV